MRKPVLRDALPAALMALVSLWAPPVAQSQAPPSQQGPGEQVRIGDEELRAFAKAYVEFQRIRQRYESSLRDAKDSAEKARIQQEGNLKAKEAVERQGISVERYNTIFTAVNTGEKLRKKTLSLINEARKKS